MEAMKEFRILLGMNTAQMAKELGISKSLYEKVEFKQRKASRNFIEKFKTRFPQFNINIFLQ